MAKISIDNKSLGIDELERIYPAIVGALNSLGKTEELIEVITIRKDEHSGIICRVVMLGYPHYQKERLRHEKGFYLRKSEDFKEEVSRKIVQTVAEILTEELRVLTMVSDWFEEYRKALPLQTFPGPKRILLIEDIPNLYLTTKALLIRAGYRVEMLNRLPKTPDDPGFQKFIADELPKFDLVIWDDELQEIWSNKGYIQAFAKSFKKPMIGCGRTKDMMEAGCTHVGSMTPQLVQQVIKILG